MKTNVSSANDWTLARDVGIGLRRTFDIRLSYRPDSNRIPRVRRMIDWIVDTFCPAKYPWFRDEFVHPRDLRDKHKRPSFASLFDI